MSDLLTRIDGYKTYIAATGLGALALYHLTQGDLNAAVHAGAQALAAAGLRHAIDKAAQ